MDYKRARYTIPENGVRIVFGDAYWGLCIAKDLCIEKNINYQHNHRPAEDYIIQYQLRLKQLAGTPLFAQIVYPRFQHERCSRRVGALA